MLKERYGRFFEYMHYLSGNETEIVELYDAERKKMFELPMEEV